MSAAAGVGQGSTVAAPGTLAAVTASAPPLDPPAGAPLLEGSLRELPLPDVLQLLELGRRTGELRVHPADAGPGGALLLVDGVVRGAELTGGDAELPGEAEGEQVAGAARDASAVIAAATLVDRACALLAAGSGRFAFHPAGARPPERAPALRVESLLVEAARRADEWARLAAWVPGPHAVPRLALDPGAPVGPVAPAARQWVLLAELDGRRSVTALARALRRSPLAVAADLAALVRAGLVVVAPAPGASSASIAAVDVPSGAARSSSA